MLSTPPANRVRPVIVTSVELLRAKEPSAKRAASVPTNMKSEAAIVPVLNVPPVIVMVSEVVPAAVEKVGEVTAAYGTAAPATDVT